MIEIELGTIARLGGNLITIVDLLPKTSGTIYVGLQLHIPGHADHGKFWDSDDDTWQALPVAWPEATHRSNGWWDFAVPTAALVLHSEIKVVFLTDNQAVPASATVIGGGYETGAVVSSTREHGVWIDSVNGTAGGNGSFTDPVDTWANATAIGSTRYNIKAGSVTLTTAPGTARIVGDSEFKAFLLLNGRECNGTAFERCYLFGAMAATTSTVITIDRCGVFGVTYLHGRIRESALQGTCGFNALNGVELGIELVDCTSYNDDDAAVPVTWDLSALSGYKRAIVANRYTGDLVLTNQDQSGCRVVLDMTSGNLVIDSSCTAGTITVRGTPTSITDNSPASCTVTVETERDVEEYIRDDALTFDAAHKLLTARRRVFPDAATANASTPGGTGEGEIATYDVTATHIDADEWESLLRVKQ